MNVSEGSSLGKLLEILDDNQTYTPRQPIVTVDNGAVQITSERFYVSELWKLVNQLQGFHLSFIITQAANGHSNITAIIRQPSTFDTARTLAKFDQTVLDALPPLWSSLMSKATFQKDLQTNKVMHRLWLSTDNNSATIAFSDGTVVIDFAEAIAVDPRVSGIELTSVSFVNNELVQCKPQMTIHLTIAARLALSVEQKPPIVHHQEQAAVKRVCASNIQP